MLTTIMYYLIKYGGAAEAVIVVALIIKAYFTSSLHKKIKNYEEYLLESESEILKLEEQNQKLQKRLHEAQGSFVIDKILLN